MDEPYVNIRVHTSEKERHEGKPVTQAVVHYLHHLKMGARCAVFRGEEGLYETGEISRASITDLSYNLPILLDILVPASELDRVVEQLKILVPHGWIGVTPTKYERTT